MRKDLPITNYLLNSESLKMILGVDCFILGFKKKPKSLKVLNFLILFYV